MYNVLILGCNGMLGDMVRRVLSRDKQFKVKCTYREENRNSFKLDINNSLTDLNNIFENQKGIDYVINCIGILNNNINENDPKSVKEAILVNSIFPNTLAALADNFKAKVIHISTDGVFSKDNKLCFESNLHNCPDIYGKTKSLGEANSANCLNLRCSIIGPSPYLKKGLFEWFLSQPKKSEVFGYVDQTWNGVTTLQFANLCKILIENNNFDVVRNEAPTHHFCPNEPVTKYELLKLFKYYFRPDLIVKPKEIQENSVSRILGTRLKKIKELFDYGYTMKNAIENLKKEK